MKISTQVAEEPLSVVDKNEGAKFWLNVLTELKNRGLNDILIACVAGNPVCVPEMDDSVEGLANGNEPLGTVNIT